MKQIKIILIVLLVLRFNLTLIPNPLFSYVTAELDNSNYFELNFVGRTSSYSFDTKSTGLYGFTSMSYREYGLSYLSIAMNLNISMFGKYIYGTGVYEANGNSPVEFFAFGTRE